MYARSVGIVTSLKVVLFLIGVVWGSQNDAFKIVGYTTLIH